MLGECGDPSPRSTALWIDQLENGMKASGQVSRSRCANAPEQATVGAPLRQLVAAARDDPRANAAGSESTFRPKPTRGVATPGR